MENGQKPGNQSCLKQIRDFTHLVTWRIARRLRVEVYRICQGFPRNETFGLASQIRRAAVSVTANMAEGFGRYSYQENIQVCRQSRGSVYELRDHFTTALDAGYITKEQYAVVDRQAISVIKLINGYIRSTKERKDIPKDRS
jgi:four helix bundle protein